MAPDEQIAELRAAVEALTARVAALEAFPGELARAFNAELLSGAVEPPSASASAPAAFSSSEQTS